ncbi:MAG: hypothetical protein HY520_05315 [Candidatus Aenigmarchaeota archaeon]|nr:hypothetical protein [Candidatus Aenigmarchaeota archaeon]
MAKKYAPLSPMGMALTGGILGLALSAIGLGWHGMLGQPSFMGMMYAAPYASPMLLGGMSFGLVVGGFILGWVGASVYNWAIAAS